MIFGGGESLSKTWPRLQLRSHHLTLVATDGLDRDSVGHWHHQGSVGVDPLTIRQLSPDLAATQGRYLVLQGAIAITNVLRLHPRAPGDPGAGDHGRARVELVGRVWQTLSPLSRARRLYPVPPIVLVVEALVPPHSWPGCTSRGHLNILVATKMTMVGVHVRTVSTLLVADGGGRTLTGSWSASRSMKE